MWSLIPRPAVWEMFPNLYFFMEVKERKGKADKNRWACLSGSDLSYLPCPWESRHPNQIGMLAFCMCNIVARNCYLSPVITQVLSLFCLIDNIYSNFTTCYLVRFSFDLSSSLELLIMDMEEDIDIWDWHFDRQVNMKLPHFFTDIDKSK